jgi:hypothetical protein
MEDDYGFSGCCIYFIGMRSGWAAIPFKKQKEGSIFGVSKKRLSHTKRRRHTLLDRDREKVIPFPTAAASSRQGDGRPGSWETKK